jgi:quinol-cytochrome oxidoreductase complex cytochrome b subunit
MGQLPGPSYPFPLSDTPSSPDEPPEQPSWWRGFVLATALLGLLVFGGFLLALLQ